MKSLTPQNDTLSDRIVMKDYADIYDNEKFVRIKDIKEKLEEFIQKLIKEKFVKLPIDNAIIAMRVGSLLEEIMGKKLLEIDNVK